MMEENSTEQRWQERKKPRSEPVWSYKRQHKTHVPTQHPLCKEGVLKVVVREWIVPSSTCLYSTYRKGIKHQHRAANIKGCLLYTSDAADERSSVDLGGRRIIKKKKKR